jgi:molybdopterin molybdotransferase
VRRLMGNFREAAIFTLPMGTGYTRRKSERKSFIPVLIRDGVVFPVEYHGSAHINAYTLANGILELEIGTISVNKGELVHVRPL